MREGHLRCQVGANWFWFTLMLSSVVAALGWLNGLGRLDALLADSLTQFNQRAPSAQIVIIAVDEASLTRLGRWPWRRATHAALLDRLAGAGAIVIGLDVLFDEASRDHPEDDLALAASIARAQPVVVPVAMLQHGGPQPLTAQPLPQIAAAAAATGHVNVELDADGVARSVFLREGTPTTCWSQFALAMLEASGNAAARRTPTGGCPAMDATPSQRGPDDWTRAAWMQISFTGPPGSFARVSYVDVLAGNVDLAMFSGKYVLIGATAAGMGDAYPTPLSGQSSLMPGVEIHANALDTLLQGTQLQLAAPWQNALFCLWPLLAALVAFRYTRPKVAFALLPCLLLLLAAVALAAYRWGGVQFAPTAALVGLALAYPLWSWARLESALRYLGEECRRTQLAAKLPLVPRMPEGGDELQRTINAMAAASEHFRRLKHFIHESLDGLSDSTMVVDPQGVILLANAAARTEFGAGAAVLEGANVCGLLRTHYGPNALFDSDGRPLFERSQGTEVEVVSAAKRDKLLKYIPWRGDPHVHAGWIVSLVDITQVRAAERLRDEAMHFISHDIRAPQASILALVATRRQATLDLEESRNLSKIEVCAQRALGLAEGFVQLARTEAVGGESVVVDLVDVLIQCVDEFWSVARLRGIVIVAAHPSHECAFLGDRSMVTRALGNLIGNAVKFSPDGAKVHCKLRAVGSGDPGERVMWELTVRDEGPGIESSDLPRLFQRFQRLGSRDGVHRNGVGLGLVYVKAVAERYQGAVRVLSVPGHGATFSFTLPPMPEVAAMAVDESRTSHA